ncbi:hypothetical protein M433DRAFT_429226 [Acidomyces richmondensis BFW]|nr:MAG: hypothetical protein FE78DRAFT_415280 [Acidomyces sp. 'richmondensis']KYG42171.1 hypothetical protein M433DRAFT_429226 [Acidomyces richmondensis BFW]
MAGLLNSIYATIVRRNYTFLGTIFIGAFATEIAFETSANKLWDQINKGVRVQAIARRF